jgi:uncharacterized protein (TIGR02118 family)
MHCVKIIYPRENNSYFNFDHYFEVHLPLALDAIQPYAEVVKIEVDRGEQGLEGAGDLPFHCICSVYFAGPDGPEGFRALFSNPTDSEPVASDIPKYTNTNPLFQFSAVVAIDV